MCFRLDIFLEYNIHHYCLPKYQAVKINFCVIFSKIYNKTVVTVFCVFVCFWTHNYVCILTFKRPNINKKRWNYLATIFNNKPSLCIRFTMFMTWKTHGSFPFVSHLSVKRPDTSYFDKSSSEILTRRIWVLQSAFMMGTDGCLYQWKLIFLEQ